MKSIKHGEMAPYGLFRREGRSGTFLRLPLFPWYGEVSADWSGFYVTGWHMRSVMVTFATGDSVIKEHSRESWFDREYGSQRGGNAR